MSNDSKRGQRMVYWLVNCYIISNIGKQRLQSSQRRLWYIMKTVVNDLFIKILNIVVGLTQYHKISWYKIYHIIFKFHTACIVWYNINKCTNVLSNMIQYCNM